MIRKNGLRKIYALWSILIGELFAVSIIICSSYIAEGVFIYIFRAAGFGAAIIIPFVVYLFYRLRCRDNNASSDEREQMVLQKAFALAGAIAATLLPALMLLCFIAPQYAGYTAFGYSAIVGASVKIGAFYYNSKY